MDAVTGVEGQMMNGEQVRLEGCVEEMARAVADFDRTRCVDALRSIAWPPLDFTADFLESQSLDRLRHLVMAAMLRAKRAS